MHNINVNQATAVCSLVIAFGSGFISIALWYVNLEKRKYGIERDFAHVRRNQEQMQIGITTILTEIDRRFDIVERDIVEIKTNFRLGRNDK